MTLDAMFAILTVMGYLKRRFGLITGTGDSIGASRVENTSCRRVQRAGQGAFKNDLTLFDIRISDRHG